MFLLGFKLVLFFLISCNFSFNLYGTPVCYMSPSPPSLVRMEMTPEATVVEGNEEEETQLPQLYHYYPYITITTIYKRNNSSRRWPGRF